HLIALPVLEMKVSEKKQIQFSLVLPAYNEEENIDLAVTQAITLLQRMFSEYEVVVVNDGSTDQTGFRAETLARKYPGLIRVLHHPTNRGYGAALRTGLFNAQGQLIFYTDADNQFDLNELATFLPLIKGYDIVVGYRQHRQDSFLRRFLSKGYNWLTRCLFGIYLKDIDCSFKLFRRSAIENLQIVSDDFLVDTELMVRAHLKNLAIFEKGVTHRPRTRGRSSIRPSHIPKTFISLLRLWGKLFLPRCKQSRPEKQKQNTGQALSFRENDQQ
ncbi:MAG: glycosyltransferase family 2 protein, partial [Candidatus Omnitrophica bacterium]|nr:glycosyltransferase family 2 protein [Candidatus Omnitrophota bacterium]